MSTFDRAELSIAASAGRQLRVLVAGPPAAIPLIFHNGTPSGLVAYEPMVTAAADRGLRMVLRSTLAPFEPGRPWRSKETGDVEVH